MGAAPGVGAVVVVAVEVAVDVAGVDDGSRGAALMASQARRGNERRASSAPGALFAASLGRSLLNS